MDESIADRYKAFLGAQPNPNPPSPERLRLEAAILPRVDAISTAIRNWRERLRGAEESGPGLAPPTATGLRGAGVNGAPVANPHPAMPFPCAGGVRG